MVMAPRNHSAARRSTAAAPPESRVALGGEQGRIGGDALAGEAAWVRRVRHELACRRPKAYY